MKTPLPPRILQLCRNLRRDGTPAETLLWTFLRNRNLRNMKFRRQHPACGYILDFYCPEVRLAIELDGGGHAEADQRLRDAERTRDLQAEGIQVLCYPNDEVINRLEDVLAEIWQALGNEEIAAEPN